MRTVIRIFLLLTISAFSNAQSNTIDSLKQLLQNEKKDTSRVLLLNQLSRIYVNLSPDTALLLGQQALLLANKTSFTKGEALSLNRIASAFGQTGNYPKALELRLEALRKSESIKDNLTTLVTLGNIGNDYYYQGDQRQSVNYMRQTLAVAESVNNQQYIQLSLSNLGDSYEKLNMLDSAMMYTNRSYDLAIKFQDDDQKGITLNNLGNIYAKMGQDAVAMSKYKMSLFYAVQEANEGNLCECYLGMARLFQKSGNTDSCLYYAKLSLATAQKAGFTSYVMDASNFLTGYFTAIHNVDSAFAYQSTAIAAKDSLFSQEKQRKIQNLIYDDTMRRQEIQNAKEEAQTQLKFNILIGGLGALLIVAFLLYRNNRQKKRANVLLKQQKEKVESTLQELKSTQAQLIQSEKMASLGELTAGIAHEIQNPLNFVNNFSEINKELLAEIKDEINKGNINEVKAIADDIISNEEKINFHGKRADAIVKGMLQHSRSSSSVKEPTDINTLTDEYIRLCYHGLRAKDKSFNAAIKTDFDLTIEKINLIPQDIGRVILNVLTNAFYAVNEKKKLNRDGYEPVVSVKTINLNDKIEIRVEDNGNGIPQHIIDKIFHPFFTTKPSGQGTGLGLSLSYDIIKAQGGEIKVKTKEGEGSEFVITLPF